MPSVVGWTWTTLGYGQGRGGLLLALLSVALLVDARSMHRAERGIPLVPELPWTDPDVAVGWTRPWSRRLVETAAETPAVVHRPLRWTVNLVEAVLALATYLVRDLVVVVVAHARDLAPDQHTASRPGPSTRVAAVLEPARAG